VSGGSISNMIQTLYGKSLHNAVPCDHQADRYPHRDRHAGPCEVATALCRDLPYSVWIMLEIEPPLTPISADVTPIRKP